jgi:hypothetical protein
VRLVLDRVVASKQGWQSGRHRWRDGVSDRRFGWCWQAAASGTSFVNPEGGVAFIDFPTGLHPPLAKMVETLEQQLGEGVQTAIVDGQGSILEASRIR